MVSINCIEGVDPTELMIILWGIKHGVSRMEYERALSMPGGELLVIVGLAVVVAWWYADSKW